MNMFPKELVRSLRELPRPVWIVYIGTFINRFGTFVIPFLTLYLTGSGFSTGQAATALAVYGAGLLLASVIGGYLADRIGRRKTIVLSMLGGSVSMIALSQAHSFPEIIVATFMVGTASELYRPASSALLADLVPPEKRVIAFSGYRLALNAGWAFGPATAGFLAKYSYDWLFVGDALSSFIYGIIAWFALPRGIVPTTKIEPAFRFLKGVIADRAFLQILFSTLCIGMVFMQMSSTVGLQMKALGMPPSYFGVLLSFNGILVVAFELWVSSISMTFPPRKAIAVGYLLIGLGFGLFLVAKTLPLFMIGMALITLGEMSAIPVSSAYVANLAPEHARGRYMGVYSLSWGVTVMIGPAGGTLLFEAHPGMVWIACGLLGVAAAAIISSGRPLSTQAPPLPVVEH